MIVFSCPHCGRTLRVEEHYASQRGRCKYCYNEVYVPAAVIPPEPSPVPKSARPVAPPAPEAAPFPRIQAGNPAGFYRATPLAVPPPRPLDNLYWILFFLCMPVALVYALTLPTGHPQKRRAVLLPLIFMIVGLALSITVVALALSLKSSDHLPLASPEYSPVPETVVSDRVYVTPDTGYYHVRRCSAVPPDARQFAKNDAVAAGYQPCPECEPGASSVPRTAPLPPAPAPTFAPVPASPTAPAKPSPDRTAPNRISEPNASLTVRTLSNTTWELTTPQGTVQIQFLPGGQAVVSFPDAGETSASWSLNGTQLAIQAEVAGQGYIMNGAIEGNTLSLEGFPATRLP